MKEDKRSKRPGNISAISADVEGGSRREGDVGRAEKGK